MSKATASVEWRKSGLDDGFLYTGNGFTVRLRDANWWAHDACKLVKDIYAPDHATAKRDAERWILEREGRLPAPATDGGGWIACSERPVEYKVPIEIRGEIQSYGTGIKLTHWRPLPVDPHAVAACLFGDDRPTLAQARAATLHVAGCAECRAKMEAKGGA